MKFSWRSTELQNSFNESASMFMSLWNNAFSTIMSKWNCTFSIRTELRVFHFQLVHRVFCAPGCKTTELASQLLFWISSGFTIKIRKSINSQVERCLGLITLPTIRSLKSPSLLEFFFLLLFFLFFSVVKNKNLPLLFMLLKRSYLL